MIYKQALPGGTALADVVGTTAGGTSVVGRSATKCNIR